MFVPAAADYPELLLYDNTVASDAAFKALLRALA